MWYYIPLAIIVVMLITLINSFRYRLILNYAKESISTVHAFLVHQIVKFSTIIVPFKMGAIVTKPVATKTLSGVEMKRSFPVTIFEQFIDIGWQIVFLPFLLIFIGEARLLSDMTVEIILLIALIGLVILAYKKRGSILSRLWRFKRVLPKKARNFGKKHGLSEEKTKKMVDQSVGYLSEWKLLLSIAIPTIAMILISPLVLQVTGLFFSVVIGYKIAFMAHWASFIIGRFSGVPSGFGTRDLSLAGFLIIFGIDPIVTAQLVILYRVINMIPSIVIGGSMSLYLGQDRIRKRAIHGL